MSRIFGKLYIKFYKSSVISTDEKEIEKFSGTFNDWAPWLFGKGWPFSFFYYFTGLESYTFVPFITSFLGYFSVTVIGLLFEVIEVSFCF